MSKLSNSLLMLQLLQNGRKYSIKELAERIEVSERMVRKYKEELEYSGILIDTIKGPYGGYVLNKDFDVPYLNMGTADIDVIKKAIPLIADPELKKALKNISSKIALNINNKEGNRKLTLSNDLEQNVFNKVSNAYKNRLKIKIKYYNLKHGESVRTVYPLGLYLFQNEWWLSAYWEEKDDMRQFHLKRIIDCEILASNFNPDEINLKF